MKFDYWPAPTGLPLCPGQSEPAPTSAPFWMDGALMGFRFSSPPVPVLTSLVNTASLILFFFPQPFRQILFLHGTCFSPSPTDLPTFTLPAYSSRPHLPTILSTTCLLAHPPTHPPTYLSTYPPPILLT
jgi:hypothetical protein